MKQKKSIASKIADGFIVAAMVIGIVMLSYVWFGSFQYWRLAIQGIQDSNALFFWAGLLIAITYAMMGFVQGFIREISNILKGKQRLKENGL